MKRQSVIVKAWGTNARNAEIAEEKARNSVELYLVDITAVKRVDGRRCPIPRHDPTAYAHAADFGWAWVAYEPENAPDDADGS